ncbi:MAG: GGDEF domain-containing response regulator, partial [Pseudomonadota bacterium]
GGVETMMVRGRRTLTDEFETHATKVLLVDDDEDYYVIVKRLLSKAEIGHFELDWVSESDVALKIMVKNEHHVCLLDYNLGKETGVELLIAAMKNGCKIPTVMLTSADCLEIDLLAMQSGAVEFLGKGELSALLLQRTLRYAIRNAQQQERLELLAQYDSLTGVLNRRVFEERLERALARARRNKGLVAIMFLDLDCFKEINDAMGHDVGDRVLKETAARVASSVREVDTVARLGGDEFGVFLEGLEIYEDAEWVAKKIIDNISHDFGFEAKIPKLSASIGISIFPTHGEDVGSLLKAADVAMYAAKKSTIQKYKFA